MKKFLYLSTCNTCNRIKDQLNLNNIQQQDLKQQHISQEELEFLRTKVNSYDDLINKRAIKYRALDLKNQDLTDHQIKQHILQEYTLLKRPILILEDKIYVGNSKKTIQQAQEALLG